LQGKSREHDSVCYWDAQNLLKALDQMLAAFPPTKEFNPITFENPKAGLRIFTDVCHHILDRLGEFLLPRIKEFRDKTNPPLDITKESAPSTVNAPYHVLICNNDKPSLDGMTIMFPDKYIFDISQYSILSHEYIHRLINLTNISAHFEDNIKKLKLNYIPHSDSEKEKLNFITEVIVEIYDFEVSFLRNYETYFKHKMHHYVSFMVCDNGYFRQGLSASLIEFLARTFIVYIWSILEKKDSKIEILDVPRDIRAALNNHNVTALNHIYASLKFLLSESNSKFNGFFEDAFKSLQLWDMQQDIFSMKDIIMDIFTSVNDVLTSNQTIEPLFKFLITSYTDEIDSISETIFSGRITHRKITYPHLLSIKLTDMLMGAPTNSTGATPSTHVRKKIAYAFVLSLWNSYIMAFTTDMDSV
jgi:hypothetical protein